MFYVEKLENTDVGAKWGKKFFTIPAPESNFSILKYFLLDIFIYFKQPF